jgi:hypothetical protein
MADKPGRIALKNANPAFRTGLLSPTPCGTDFLQLPNDLRNPDCDMLSWRAWALPDRRPILKRNDVTIICETVH